MKLCQAIIVLFSFISFSVFAQTPKVTVLVNLTPAGSFQATTSNIKGRVSESGGLFQSQKIYVPVKSFKTGIDLRDEHFYKHLSADKSPYIGVSGIKGKDGKGVGTLEINGIKKAVGIAYTVSNGWITAKFKTKASDFKLPKAQYMGVGVDDIVIVEAVLPAK